MRVSAGVIFRAGRVLICQRAASGAHAGLWEFPGGKQEPGETAAQCLARECREELAIDIDVGEVLKAFAWHTGNAAIPIIDFTFFRASLPEGEPVCLEHAALAWVPPGALRGYPFCPADAGILPLLADA